MSGLAAPHANLVDLLRLRSAEQPDRVAFTFFEDGETETARLTYAELDARARALAARLHSLGVEGKRVLLLYPSGLDFIVAFFGCLYAGAVAVPAPAPRLNRPQPRLQALVADAGAALALTTRAILANLERRFEHLPELAALQWLSTDGLSLDPPPVWQPPAIQPDSLALLQYTSGSTSAPKGVMITHANLLANLEVIRQGFQTEAGGTAVMWLPLYHDMGLIGGVLEPLYVGAPAVLMPPAAVLQRPLRWLQAVARHDAVFSGGPTFAFELCLEQITPAQRATLDLSRWRVAFCGAEPIRVATLERFAEAFALSGFRRERFFACYGLAEATLMVSGGLWPSGPAALRLSRPALAQHRVAPAAADVGVSVADCGQPLSDHVIAIVDPVTGRRCAPEAVGEIWVAGPSVAQGYWGQPELTAEIFQAHVLDEPGQRPYLRTGDLGFQRAGHVYVTGRLKDLIIVRGQNYYAHDLERAVEASHAGLPPGGGAAFAFESPGQPAEAVALVYELDRQTSRADWPSIISAIRQAVAEQCELDLQAVALLKPLSLPRTTSGKVMRYACRAAFEAGTLSVLAEWRAPAAPAANGAHPPAERPVFTQTGLEDWLIARLAQRLDLAPDDIDVQMPFQYYGLDSADAVAFTRQISQWLDRDFEATLLMDYPTIASLARHLTPADASV